MISYMCKIDGSKCIFSHLTIDVLILCTSNYDFDYICPFTTNYVDFASFTINLNEKWYFW